MLLTFFILFFIACALILIGTMYDSPIRPFTIEIGISMMLVGVVVFVISLGVLLKALLSGG